MDSNAPAEYAIKEEEEELVNPLNWQIAKITNPR